MQPVRSSGTDAWSEVRKARLAIFVAAPLMLAAAATAVAAAPNGAARYAGSTSQGLAVRLRVSADGGYVARMHIRYRVRCSDGASGAPVTDLFDLRIDRHGGFGFHGTYTGRSDKSKNHVRMHGKVSRGRAAGSFLLTARRNKVHCRSARIAWHAHATS
jgi:hypothetical protein